MRRSSRSSRRTGSVEPSSVGRVRVVAQPDQRPRRVAHVERVGALALDGDAGSLEASSPCRPLAARDAQRDAVPARVGVRRGGPGRSDLQRQKGVADPDPHGAGPSVLEVEALEHGEPQQVDVEALRCREIGCAQREVVEAARPHPPSLPRRRFFDSESAAFRSCDAQGAVPPFGAQFMVWHGVGYGTRSTRRHGWRYSPPTASPSRVAPSAAPVCSPPHTGGRHFYSLRLRCDTSARGAVANRG